MSSRRPQSQQPDFIDAGQLYDTQFNVSYSPIVNVTTQSSTANQRSGASTIQHLYVSPVPHVSIEQNEEPVLIRNTLRPLDDIDIANWKNLSGTIIICLMIMMLISVFICLSRPDFNFVFYLFGYYLWCIESKNHHSMESVRSEIYPRTSELRLASKSTMEAAKYFAVLLTGAILIDISWLYMGISSWLCKEESMQSCWPGTELQGMIHRIKATYHLHQFVIFASILNMIGKSVVVILSVIWTLQQQRHHKSLNSCSYIYDNTTRM